MSDNVEKSKQSINPNPPPLKKEDHFCLPGLHYWDSFDGSEQPAGFYGECARCGQDGMLQFGFRTHSNQYCRTGIHPSPPPPPITVINVKEEVEQCTKKPDLIIRVKYHCCNRTVESKNCRLVRKCGHVLCVRCCNKRISISNATRCSTISCPICEQLFTDKDLMKVNIDLV